MPLEALAELNSVLHIYDFKVKPGMGEDFITAFNEFDYSDDNIMHQSAAQVKDGVLCRDTEDPDRFYLVGEWRSVEAHREILQQIGRGPKPRFFDLLESPKFVPSYGTVVSSTPAEYLEKVNRRKAGSS